MISDRRLNEIITEELTKSEVSSIANRQISSGYKSKDFQETVKKIVADCLGNFVKALYQRDSMWKSDVKR